MIKDYLKLVQSYLYKHDIIGRYKRRIRKDKNNKRLRNKDITIISNNCLAGVLYSDCKIRFLSPTINLFFETFDDYLEYLSDISYYSSTVPVEIESDHKYPVGEIRKEDRKITIHFMHYSSFEEASSKWIERGGRINYNNMIVIWMVGDVSGPSMENYERFKKLNIKNKLLITGTGFPVENPTVIRLSFFSEGNTPGKWAKYKNEKSAERYIDEMDYIKYFNSIEKGQ